LQDYVENEWKDDVDERGDEAIKHVEICPSQPRGAVLLDKTGAWETRAERACEEWKDAERESELDKAGTLGRLRLAVWIFIILTIWTQLFHCK